jgi:hypothetical protein
MPMATGKRRGRAGLFPTSGGITLFRHQIADKKSPKATAGSARPARLARKWAYRFYYKNGLITFERFKISSRVFFSFHYTLDHQRVRKIRQMRRDSDSSRRLRAERWQIGIGKLPKRESWGDRANQFLRDSDWQVIKAKGDDAISQWIDDQMRRKSCVIVLIGADTASRPWVNHEIRKGWNDGKGIVGVHIHNLADKSGMQSAMGRNPFDNFTVGGQPMSKIVRAYDPPFQGSDRVFDYIETHLSSWVEQAIDIRQRNHSRASLREASA